MQVKILEGIPVLLWDESKPGYSRGRAVGYIGFDLETAEKIGAELVAAAKECNNRKGEPDAENK